MEADNKYPGWEQAYNESIRQRDNALVCPDISRWNFVEINSMGGMLFYHEPSDRIAVKYDNMVKIYADRKPGTDEIMTCNFSDCRVYEID